MVLEQLPTSSSTAVQPIESPTALKKAALSPLVAHAPLVFAGGRALSTPEPQAAPQQSSLRLEPYRRWQTAAISSPVFDSVDRTAVTAAHERDGATYFTVNVYLSLPSSRLPASEARGDNAYMRRRRSTQDPSDDDTRAPVCQLERRYSDFERLRREITSAVCVIPQCQCSYCLDFMVYLRFHWQQPGALHKLLGSGKNTEKRRKMLDAFLSDMVALAQRPTLKFEHRRRGGCGARERVQALLNAFLLE